MHSPGIEVDVPSLLFGSPGFVHSAPEGMEVMVCFAFICVVRGAGVGRGGDVRRWGRIIVRGLDGQ